MLGLSYSRSQWFSWKTKQECTEPWNPDRRAGEIVEEQRGQCCKHTLTADLGSRTTAWSESVRISHRSHLSTIPAGKPTTRCVGEEWEECQAPLAPVVPAESGSPLGFVLPDPWKNGGISSGEVKGANLPELVRGLSSLYEPGSARAQHHGLLWEELAGSVGCIQPCRDQVFCCEWHSWASAAHGMGWETRGL